MEATLQGFGSLSQGKSTRRTSTKKKRAPAKRSTGGSSSSTPAGYVTAGSSFRFKVSAAKHGLFASALTDEGIRARILTVLEKDSHFDNIALEFSTPYFSYSEAGDLVITGRTKIDRGNLRDVRDDLLTAAQTGGFLSVQASQAEIQITSGAPARQRTPSTQPDTYTRNASPGGATNYSLFGSTPNGLPPVPGAGLYQSIKDEFATASLGALAVAVGLLFVVFKK